MKRFFICTFLSIAFLSVSAQDTITYKNNQAALRKVLLVTDTSRVVYDQNGVALKHTEYQKLINTGNYVFKADGDPTRVGTRLSLKKLSENEKETWLNRIKGQMPIASPVLEENMIFNTQVFKNAVNVEDLKNKPLLLVFWSSSLPVSFEDFKSINEIIKRSQMANLKVLLITRDKFENANAILRESPIEGSILISKAENTLHGLGLNTYPSYVITDESHIIRLAMSGTSNMAIPAMRATLSKIKEGDE